VDVAETTGELSSLSWLQHRPLSNGFDVTYAWPLISVLRIVLPKFIILGEQNESGYI